MRILAIETSCDETAIAVIETLNQKGGGFKILSNIVASQVKIHRKWGGIYPTLAKREHQRNLPIVFKKALWKAGFANSKSQGARKNGRAAGGWRPNSKQIPRPKGEARPTSWAANSKFQILKEILKREGYLFEELGKFLLDYKKPEIDILAITVGPGLEPCLWVGVNFAKALAFFWKLPIVSVNHIKAHIFANCIRSNFQFSSTNFQNLFPAICLVVSGGHTQLILMRDLYNFKIIGETRDDAAGECFDKIARILGLGYPGGPAIEAEATKLQTRNYKLKTELPRPMIYQKNFDFSFSGLKTAVLYHYRSQPKKLRKSKKYIRAMAAETQQAIIDVLIAKTLKAAREYKVKSIILGGGVVANKELRRQFQQKIKKEIPHTKYLIPDTKLATDNAVMIGIAGFYTWLDKKREDWKKIEAQANLRIR